MGRGARALMALVVAAMLVLSGCGAQSPRNAATVGGVVITEEAVQAAAQGLANGSAQPGEAGSWRRTAATVLVSNELTRQVAEKVNASVTDAEVQQTVAGNEQLATLVKEPELVGFINDYARTNLLANKIGQEPFIAAAKQIDVDLNPRYGSWDPAAPLQLTGTGSLSSPAPSAATGAQG